MVSFVYKQVDRIGTQDWHTWLQSIGTELARKIGMERKMHEYLEIKSKNRCNNKKCMVGCGRHSYRVFKMYKAIKTVFSAMRFLIKMFDGFILVNNNKFQAFLFFKKKEFLRSSSTFTPNKLFHAKILPVNKLTVFFDWRKYLEKFKLCEIRWINHVESFNKHRQKRLK